MKKMIVALIVSLFNLQAFATVTLNVNGADLALSNNVLMATSGLIVVVADTSGNGFYTGTSLLPEASVALQYSFLQDDDLIIWRGPLESSSGPGVFSQGLANLIFTNNWGQGDPVALYWFPTLTTAASTVGALTWYGMYTTNVAIDGTTPGSGGWFTPSDGSLITLNFITATEGGSNPDSRGYAFFQTIPEPSACVLVGMGLLGTWLLRRRHR